LCLTGDNANGSPGAIAAGRNCRGFAVPSSNSAVWIDPPLTTTDRCYFAVRNLRLVIVICGVALAYAVLRYNALKGVSIEQLPLYVVNKAASLAAIVLIGFAAFQRTNVDRKEMGIAGFALLAGHVVISMMILNPAYFKALYGETGRLTWQGELSMLAGVIGLLAAVWLFVATYTQPPPRNAYGVSLVPGLGRFVLLCGAVHVFAIGVRGWFDLHVWPGFLPPITLLSFLAAVVFVLVRHRQKRRAARLQTEPADRKPVTSGAERGSSDVTP